MSTESVIVIRMEGDNAVQVPLGSLSSEQKAKIELARQQYLAQQVSPPSTVVTSTPTPTTKLYPSLDGVELVEVKQGSDLRKSLIEAGSRSDEDAEDAEDADTVTPGAATTGTGTGICACDDQTKCSNCGKRRPCLSKRLGEKLARFYEKSGKWLAAKTRKHPKLMIFLTIVAGVLLLVAIFA